MLALNVWRVKKGITMTEETQAEIINLLKVLGFWKLVEREMVFRLYKEVCGVWRLHYSQHIARLLPKNNLASVG